MKKYFEILRRCALFENIEDQSLLSLLGCIGARVESFEKKYTVLAEGSPARYICILLSGAVQVVQNDYYGNRSILTEVSPAEMFAEEFACSETESIPVSVVAIEPSRVMLVDCRRVLHSCSNACGCHQQMIYNLMRDLAEKTIVFHRRIEITSKRSTREKLMTYLMQCAQKAGKRSFEIPFDRQELADYLEVDRSGLSAEIGKMKRDGLLENRKNRFTLLT